jgi:AraC-like DNA-binding protein
MKPKAALLPGQLEAVYRKARADEPQAWLAFQHVAQAHVLRILKRTFSADVPRWLLEDKAEEAFFYTMARSRRIPDAVKALRYASKASLSLVKSELTRRTFKGPVLSELNGDLPDPRAARPARRLEATDELQWLSSTSTTASELLSAMREITSEGRRLSLSRLSSVLGVSARTIRRRMAHIAGLARSRSRSAK